VQSGIRWAWLGGGRGCARHRYASARFATAPQPGGLLGAIDRIADKKRGVGRGCKAKARVGGGA